MQKKHHLYCMCTCIALMGLVFMYRGTNNVDRIIVSQDPSINIGYDTNSQGENVNAFENNLSSGVQFEEQPPFLPQKYEENSSCSVRVFSDKTQFNNFIEKVPYEPKACSLEFFKHYINNHRKLLGNGAWSIPPDRKLSLDVDFYPEGCHFPQELTNAEKMQKCFEQKNMRKFLITGDSHSVILRREMGYFVAELNGGTDCYRFRKSRGEMTDYFQVPYIDKETMQTNDEPSQEATCQLVNNSSFLLEKIEMLHLLDGTIRVDDPTSMKGRFLPRAYFTVTKLEFLLKHYFPYKGFPDVWLFMFPFHHDCWNNSVEKIRLDILYMMELFKMYLPDTTTLIFLPTTRECQDLQPPEIAPQYEGYYKRKRNPTIHDMNQQLVRVLLESKPRDNTYAFLDVNKISCPFMCKWHHDGAHMLPEWYAKVIRYILETYCSDTHW